MGHQNYIVQIETFDDSRHIVHQSVQVVPAFGCFRASMAAAVRCDAAETARSQSGDVTSPYV
jgi:hypothetical protein